VYAHRRQAAQHEAALEALREVSTGSRSWGIPVFVVGEFVRLVTHPSLFEYPSSLEDAFAALRGLLQSRRALLLRPGRRYWAILQDVVIDGHATGNHMFDAQIAAVCLEHGADTILTEDRDFRRFSGLRVRHLEEA
jgi:toxin-antitoxin system PIN domain toxin